MTANSVLNGGSQFRIRRPPGAKNGSVSTVDADVKKHLDHLNERLGRRVLIPAPPARPPQAAPAAAGAVAAPAKPRQTDLKRVLRRDLEPRRTTAPHWAKDSLVAWFDAAPEHDDYLMLSEVIDRTPDLSDLRYAVDASLSKDWTTLDEDAQIILQDGYSAIKDYLVAYAFHVMQLKDVKALKHFILSNRSGVRRIAEYATVSAGRTVIDRDKLLVPNFDDDDSEIVRRIEAARPPLRDGLFRPRLAAVVDDVLFNSDEADLIENANIGVIPEEIKPQLIRHIKSSPVPITPANVQFFLPLFISQIKGGIDVPTMGRVDPDEADRDFEVQFFLDDEEQVRVNRSAIKCAAQLYYAMVLGDELDVFEVVNYFTHKYLVRESFTIEDRRLRDDLQSYVFSGKFTVTDARSNLKRTLDRTRPAERQMFYRQVFNSGGGQAPEDLVVNEEFGRLWKLLMLESANYLQRAQLSPNPDSFVSKQNVMQAVEDLQYNLSVHCTGMANVITPLIYEELNFVTRRILMHREVLRNVAPAGGTWWKVVERLHAEMRGTRTRATVLNNKARLGHDIIRAIAQYDPDTFEDDRTFGPFISTVDAFISTQSILQEALTEDLKRHPEEPAPDGGESDAAAVVPAGAGNDDEWDF